MLDDIVIEFTDGAYKSFGEIMGRLIVAGGLDFKVVKVLKKMEDDMLQKAVFPGAMRIFTSDPSEDKVLISQVSEIKERESLFSVTTLMTSIISSREHLVVIFCFSCNFVSILSPFNRERGRKHKALDFVLGVAICVPLLELNGPIVGPCFKFD